MSPWLCFVGAASSLLSLRISGIVACICFFLVVLLGCLLSSSVHVRDFVRIFGHPQLSTQDLRWGNKKVISGPERMDGVFIFEPQIWPWAGHLLENLLKYYFGKGQLLRPDSECQAAGVFGTPGLELALQSTFGGQSFLICPYSVLFTSYLWLPFFF